MRGKYEAGDGKLVDSGKEGLMEPDGGGSDGESNRGWKVVSGNNKEQI